MITDGDRLHDALCAAWERLCDAIEDARFERREGYVWTVCPSVPVPLFNGVWPLDDAAAPAVEGALHEVAELGLPYSVQLRSGRTPRCEREVERLGLLVESELPGMVVEPDALGDADIPDLQLIRVRTADGLAQALALAADAFNAPPEIFAPLYTSELAAVEGFAVYIGRVGEIDVTTGIGLTLGVAGVVEEEPLHEELERRVEPEFDGFEAHPVVRAGTPATALVVEAAVGMPLVFVDDGELYFRRGGRSTRAHGNDVRDFILRQLNATRRQWIANIRQVMHAPDRAEVAIVETADRDEEGRPTLIRLTTDPHAPLYGQVDPDQSHPYRQNGGDRRGEQTPSRDAKRQ